MKLRPRANIIHILGDELISNDRVAIIELLKNAYDADATEATVRFEGDIENGRGNIIISDNGDGMSLETVMSGWFEPATQIKRANRVTSRGRRVLGEKGIGRFASARLSSRLEMITRKRGTDAEISAIFDWGAFDRKGYLDEVECSWEKRKPSLVSKHGTVLRLIDIKSKWGRDEIQNLRNSLSQLISPFEQVIDFAIKLDLHEGFQDMGGVIAPSKLLAHPHYTIKGRIEGNGAYKLVYTQENAQSEEIPPGTFDKFRSFASGPFDIELRVWDRDRPAIEKLADIFNLKSKQVRDELDEGTGVHVYRDGFHVLPYGEPNSDWLRLDIRRVQNPTMRVSNNQVLGCIMISADRNPELRDQTNREGLMATQALEDLKTLVIATLNLLERRRYSARPRKERKPLKGGIFEGFTLEPVRGALEKKYPADKQVLQLVTESERELNEKIEVVQDVLARYRRLATLGQLVDIFLHDGRIPLNKISSEATLATDDFEKDKTPSLFENLRKRLGFILAQSSVLSQLFKKMEPFGGRKRGRPARITLESIVKTVFDIYEDKLKKAGVVFDPPTSKTEVTVDPVELQQVFINLLENSLYWLEKQTEPGKRQISVEVQRTVSNEVVIMFCDSGPGVSEEDREDIFKPYFSTKPNGVGLGLSIAGEIVAEYDGDLELVDGPLSGACFRITLRRRI